MLFFGLLGKALAMQERSIKALSFNALRTGVVELTLKKDSSNDSLF
jgi:hypothetical protein